MGLISGVVTLPLAPVRAVGWLAQQLVEEARRQASDETAVRQALSRAQDDLETGRLTPEEYERLEDELIDRLLLMRRIAADG